MRTTITAIATLALGLGALSACTTDPEPTPTSTVSTTPTASTTPTPSPSPTASDTPSPTPSQTLDADQQAAQNIVNEFFRISDELVKDPELPLQPLADITTGETQSLELKAIAEYRAMNAVQVGDLEWAVVGVGPATDEGDGKLVMVDACTDATDLDVVNQDTKESVLPDDRTPVLRWTIDTVEDNGYWRVGDLTNTAVKDCLP